MSKEALKKAKEQICVRCGEIAPKDFSLIDVHRPGERQNGWTYDDGYGLICPTCHMKEHGTYRERIPDLENLKQLFDGYKQIQKTRLKINNQLLATKRRTDSLDEIDVAFINGIMDEVEEKEKAKEKMIASWCKSHKDVPIVKAMMSVKGVGPCIIAALLSYVDITKTRHASSLWSYAGYHKPSHRRMDKIEKAIEYVNFDGKTKKRWYSCGNRTLRCQLFVTAGVMIKREGPYRDVYDRRKAQTEQSELVTETRITGKTGVHKVMWKDVSKGHRHGDALRVMMKHFLADLWYVWRTLEGLPIDDLYVKEHLGHESAIINPRQRGWEF
jgi:hypothetical protein